MVVDSDPTQYRSTGIGELSLNIFNLGTGERVCQRNFTDSLGGAEGAAAAIITNDDYAVAVCGGNTNLSDTKYDSGCIY